jgi:GNAT superfamily N-acetyltransferase
VDDIDAVTETVTLAFLDDPVWGPALAVPDGSTEHLAPYWRPYVEQAVEYGTAYVRDDAAAVAIWTPPGEPELSDERAADVLRVAYESLPPDLLAAMVEIFERFEAAHPREVPHAYLGLLATHPSHRGHGIGQQLLAENLAHWDALGVPAYLESSNPANLHRYERAGFIPVGSFTAVVTDAVLTTMWRDAVPVGG